MSKFRPRYSISTFYSSRGFMAFDTRVSFPETKGFRLTLGLINYENFGKKNPWRNRNFGLLDLSYRKELGFLSLSARIRYLAPLGERATGRSPF